MIGQLLRKVITGSGPRRDLPVPPVVYFAEHVHDVPEVLAGRFDGEVMRRRASSPDGVSGLLVWRGPGLAAYDEEVYEFRRCGENLRLGFLKKFEPEMVRRRSSFSIAGYPVRMANGECYLIPAVLPESPDFGLPTVDRIGEDGQWRREVPDGELRFLSEAARRIFDALDGEGVPEGFDDTTLRRVAVAAIGVCYDLSELEIGVRGLLDNAAYTGVIEALLDAPALLELRSKKKTSEG